MAPKASHPPGWKTGSRDHWKPAARRGRSAKDARPPDRAPRPSCAHPAGLDRTRTGQGSPCHRAGQASPFLRLGDGARMPAGPEPATPGALPDFPQLWLAATCGPGSVCSHLQGRLQQRRRMGRGLGDNGDIRSSSPRGQDLSPTIAAFTPPGLCAHDGVGPPCQGPATDPDTPPPQDGRGVGSGGSMHAPAGTLRVQRAPRGSERGERYLAAAGGSPLGRTRGAQPSAAVRACVPVAALCACSRGSARPRAYELLRAPRGARPDSGEGGTGSISRVSARPGWDDEHLGRGPGVQEARGAGRTLRGTSSGPVSSLDLAASANLSRVEAAARGELVASSLQGGLNPSKPGLAERKPRHPPPVQNATGSR